MSKTFAQLAAFVGALIGTELFALSDGASKKVTAFQLRQRTGHRIVGNWVPMGDRATGASGVLAANRLYFVPVWLDEKVTISDLGIRVTTLVSGGKVAVAIYASDPTTLKPTGLPLAKTGDLDTTLAQTVSGDIVGADVTLSPGLYFMAICADATAGGTVAVTTFNGAAGVGWMIGSATLANVAASSGNVYLGYFTPMTYATGFVDATAAVFTEQTSAIGVLIFTKISAVF